MSLGCLTCSQVLQRTDSFREMLAEKEKGYREVLKKVDRTWSGNISPPPKSKDTTKGGTLAMIKANHRRVHSADFLAGSEPKLVRSSGMRREWSFENLTAEQKDQIFSRHLRSEQLK